MQHGLNKEKREEKHLIIAFHHTVADADLCENVLGFRRVLFDLAANVCHVDPQDLVSALALRTPQFTEDVIISEYSPRTPCQQGNNAVLVLGQMAVFTRDEHLMLVIIDGEVPGKDR